ncbi:MAG: metallophosphoesterase [Bacteroidia bacterium]|nr:metallophosphoesterase [Bacteroidia bacterium]
MMKPVFLACSVAAVLMAAFPAVLSAQTGTFNADGPYITYLSDSTARVVTVDAGGNISTDMTAAPKPGDTFNVTEHSGRWTFDVTLHESVRPEWKRDASQKIFVTSDPHGRMDCLVTLLQRWGVVDASLDWSFGSDQLVVIGDVCDRGEDATQIYWLLYQLEAQAEAAGGHVTFVYGNHEPMILSGDYRYSKPKYTALADSLGTTYRELMGPDTELGRWLATRNTMEVIGDNLFVHAGIGRDLLDKNLEIPEINERASHVLFMTKDERKADSELNYFLVRTYGPIWYRGLVYSRKKYRPASKATVLEALDRYDVSRIYVGHTIFRNVKKFYGGLVTDVNVDNAANQAAGRSRALLIDGDKRYVVNDTEIVKEF